MGGILCRFAFGVSEIESMCVVWSRMLACRGWWGQTVRKASPQKALSHQQKRPAKTTTPGSPRASDRISGVWGALRDSGQPQQAPLKLEVCVRASLRGPWVFQAFQTPEDPQGSHSLGMLIATTMLSYRPGNMATRRSSTASWGTAKVVWLELGREKRLMFVRMVFVQLQCPRQMSNDSGLNSLDRLWVCGFTIINPAHLALWRAAYGKHPPNAS